MTDHIQNWKPKWECAARKQSLPEPEECDWPVCGCDPYADKVIDALHERGLLVRTETGEMIQHQPALALVLNDGERAA